MTVRNPSIIIIGAGMSGICLAIKLRERGFHQITLLEKAATMGGTWRENTYPGLTCDVPSHAYTYSFEPNPSWSSLFPSGSEIFEYFEQVYNKHCLDEITHFNEAVTHCLYDDKKRKWNIKTSQDHYESDFVFAATGLLHHPVFPDIPGKENFDGISMHSAQWDHSRKLNNKRIGVIGTGSSATQLIPELINMPDTDVHVFQRTPQWIVPVPNPPHGPLTQRFLAKRPGRMLTLRKLILWFFEKTNVALTGTGWRERMLHKLFTGFAKRGLASVKDPKLRQKLTPQYQFGCKRVIINATFYPAIQQPNAHLITDPIVAIEKNGVRTTDGVLHEVDVIIYATGFNPIAYMRPMEFRGRNNLSIDDAWGKKVRAYHSLMVPGFPNFFCMVGPNSPIGNFSIISISEKQADWCIQLIELWKNEKLPVVECTQTALDNWSNMLKIKMKNTVWASGCNSWYLDNDGDPITWPDNWKNWLKQMESPRLEDFVR